MNQEFKNIDDLFQSAFADDSAEVPAFVKMNIDKKLESTKNKRAWIWFGSLLLLLLISASTFWRLNQNDTNLNGVTSDSNNRHSTNQTNDSEALTSNSKESSTPSSTNNTATNDNQTQSQITQQDSDLNKKSGSDNSGIAGTDPSETKSNLTDSNSELDQGTKKTTDKKQSGNDTGTSSKDPGATEPSFKSQTIDVDPKSDFFIPLSARLFEKQGSGKILSPVAKSLTTTNPLTANSHNRANEIQALPFEVRDIYNPWMISLTGGLNYSTSKYTFPTSSEKDYYEKSTFSAPTFEGNLDVKYRLSNSLTFGTGVGISKLTENYQFFKETIDIDTTIEWTYQDIYEYDSLLDTTVWVGIDSTSQSIYDTTAVTIYDETGTTQATYLHIPFSIGTQIIRNKFRFDFYAAGRFNLLLNGSGGYLQNDVFTAFNKSANQIFKPWSVDLILGTAAHYQLFEKLYLTGTFRFRPAIGDLYQGVNFKRSFQSYHVGVGLSWKL